MDFFSGEGNQFTIASNNEFIPIPVFAEPNKTGIKFCCSTAFLRAEYNSFDSIASSSMNLFSKISSVSAIFSISSIFCVNLY